MNRCSRFVVAGVLAVTANACDEPNFETEAEITKLRTLVITLEPPELGPGDIGQLSSLTVTPDERDLTYSWEVCLFDEGPDGSYACAVDSETGEIAGITLSSSPRAELPYDVLVAAIGSIEELCSSFDEFDLPDFIELPTCTRGIPLTARLTVTDDTGDEEISVRDVFLLRADAADGTQNQNPEIIGLTLSQLVAGELTLAPTVLSLTSPPTLSIDLTNRIELQALANTDVAELYQPLDEDGEPDGEEVLERMEISWFSTHGDFRRSQSYFDEMLAPGEEFQFNLLNLEKNTAALPGDTVTVHAVIRDNRGGASFVSGAFIVGAGE
jgi:hypothetical protein